MYKSIIVSLLVAVCLVSLIQAQKDEDKAYHLKVYPCKGEHAKPMSKINKLKIAGAKGYPVTLTRGENASISIEFTPTSKITQCNLKIIGELGGKQVPFSATNDPNHCLDSIKETKGKKNFMLARNKPYTYQFSMPVKDEYPAVSVVINYQLMFGNKAIACFTFPAKIV